MTYLERTYPGRGSVRLFFLDGATEAAINGEVSLWSDCLFALGWVWRGDNGCRDLLQSRGGLSRVELPDAEQNTMSFVGYGEWRWIRDTDTDMDMDLDISADDVWLWRAKFAQS